MPAASRHFTGKHPLFKARRSASGVWWENNIYYLWYEFLRRHPGYKVTCGTGGKGEYAELYADFGDVRDGDFQKCWASRGERLFAEPLTSVSVLKPDDLSTLSNGWDTAELLVVAIPLKLPKADIEQILTKLLKQHHKRRRGQRTLTESRARYSISSQYDTGSLQTALRVYDCLQARPKPQLWKVAQELKIGKRKHLLKPGDAPGEITSKKAALSIAASKRYKIALRIIDGVGRGEFPAVSASKRKG
jgi:hypothetical protein